MNDFDGLVKFSLSSDLEIVSCFANFILFTCLLSKSDTPMPVRAYKSAQLIDDSDDEPEIIEPSREDLPEEEAVVEIGGPLADPDATTSKASASNKRRRTMPDGEGKFPDNLIFTISTTILVVPVPKISYQLKLAPKSELNKQPQKRKNQVRILTLSADLNWDTMKAQILVKIEDCMKPKKLDFDDYDVCFTIPRKVSDPTPLATEDDYGFLLKNVTKCMDKTAYIYICAVKVSFSYCIATTTTRPSSGYYLREARERRGKGKP